MIDWSKYPNFSEREMACSHTLQCEVQPELMDALQALRTAYGRELRVTSGYRSPRHPKEHVKREPGMHAKGLAVDISCDSGDAFQIIKLALELGFRGIGVSQAAGRPRFIHLDLRPGAPVVYSY